MTKLILCRAILASILTILTSVGFSNQAAAPSPRFPLKNGYIILGVPVKFDSLIPTQTSIAHTKYILPLIYEPLLTVNSKQELVPVLAKTWVVSPDKKKITITINLGHYFSDKTEVTAEDVAQSFYRICSKDSQAYTKLTGLNGCSQHANGKKILPEVHITGKYEISFNINCSPSNFLYQLSLQSAVVTKATGSHLIGSGPYELEEHHDEYVILKRNTYYSGNNPPMNTGVIFLYAVNKKLADMLIAGSIDGAIIYRIADIPPLQKNKYKLINSNSNISEILVLNNNRYPFNKKILRNALASEIYNHFDHSCLIGARKAYGIIPTGIGGSITANKPASLPEYSAEDVFKKIPTLRKKHTVVTLHQLEDLKSSCESKQIKIALAKYNIDAQFKYHKDYSTLSRLVNNHKLDGFIELYVYTGTDAYSVLQKFSKTGENHANTSDDQVGRILNEATMAQTSHVRYQTYNRLTNYIQDESIVIPLFYMNHGTLLKNCLSGISDDFFFSPFIFIPKLYKTKTCIS